MSMVVMNNGRLYVMLACDIIDGGKATRRFGKKVPSALVELVEECWAPAMEDRPDFKDITKRFEIIWGAPLFPTPRSHVSLTFIP